MMKKLKHREEKEEKKKKKGTKASNDTHNQYISDPMWKLLPNTMGDET